MNNTTKKVVGTALATSAVWAMLIAASTYASQFTNLALPKLQLKEQKVQVVVANRNIKIGETIKLSDLTTKDYTMDYVVPGASTNPNYYVGMVAENDVYKNQQILQKDFIQSKYKDNGLVPYTVSATLLNLSDEKINIGDYVDVNVSFNKNENRAMETAASKIAVSHLIDSKGTVIKTDSQNTSTNTQTPAYIVLMCTKNDMKMIDDAAKSGSLRFIKYNDKNAKATKVNYVPSWTATATTSATSTTPVNAK